MCASCAGRLALYSCSADTAEDVKRGHSRRNEVAVSSKEEEEEEEEEEEDEAPDGGWGWVVTFGCFIIAFLVDLLGPCFGIIFSKLLLNLRTSSTSVAWLFNLRAFIFNMSTLLLGPLMAELGWRVVAFLAGLMCALGLGISAFATSTLLLLTYSILTGIGGGLLMGIIFSIIPHYFKKRRGVANAFMMVGLSAGQMAGPLLINYLQVEYGYLGGTLVLSAIVLNCCVGAAVFQPVEWHVKKCNRKFSDNNNIKRSLKPKADTVEPAKTSALFRVFNTTLNNLKLLKSSRILIIALISALNMISYLNFLMMVPFVLQTIGFSMQETTWCVSVSGLCNMVSRLVVSALTDCPGFSMRACYMLGTTVVTAGMIAFSLLRDLTGLTVVMGLWGCGVGAFMSIYSLIMVEYVGLDKHVPTLGVCGLFNSVGFLISGTLTGYMRDVSGSYAVSIWLLASSSALSLVLWTLMPLAVKCDRRREAGGETGDRPPERNPS
ncbi:monocarboxylate transporter 13-like [Penaeus japonicus]|nr:monocarboxylate transporter 13-like [Penaeus japonicus]